MSGKHDTSCHFPSFRLAVLFLLFLLLVAKAANVTVDDASSAWTYHSIGSGTLQWGEITPSHSCSFCLSRPDPTRVYNNTWHDTDLGNSASLPFTGISLTVYIICPGPLSGGAMYATNYTFTMDGMDDGSFQGHGCSTMTYNYAVYTKIGLTATSHVFTITNAAPPPSISQPRSDLLLDYAIYDDGGLSTTSASTLTSTSRPTSTPAPSSSSVPALPSNNHGTQLCLPGMLTILGIVAGAFVVGVMA